MQYRRRMHMTYQQVRDMPGRQLLLDLEMMSLEAKYGPSNAKPQPIKHPNTP